MGDTVISKRLGKDLVLRHTLRRPNFCILTFAHMLFQVGKSRQALVPPAALYRKNHRPIQTFQQCILCILMLPTRSRMTVSTKVKSRQREQIIKIIKIIDTQDVPSFKSNNLLPECEVPAIRNL